jgi:colicin import membrane protein
MGSRQEDRRAEAARRRAEWEARQEVRAKKTQEWEARQQENAKKKAEWEATQAAWKARSERRLNASNRAVKMEKDCDLESNATEVSTALSMTSTAVDEAEVERMAMLDKEVRKYAKLLREIEKLEGRSDLDKLQEAKLARKAEVRDEFNYAKSIAETRDRYNLRMQVKA